MRVTDPPLITMSKAAFVVAAGEVRAHTSSTDTGLSPPPVHATSVAETTIVTDVPVHPMAMPPVHIPTMWGAAEESSTW
jgi:hypothetical protein